MYAISMVDNLVMNFFEHGGYRKRVKLKRMIDIVKCNPTWKYMLEVQAYMDLPEPKNSVMKYLTEPNTVHFMKVYGMVKLQEIKKLVKQVILRE